jgi:hypothetical protein
MGTVNALLLNVKRSLLLADPEDSSRQFLYWPRSLHTACLTEYHPTSSLSTKTQTPSPKRKSRALVEKESPLLQANNGDGIMDPVTGSNDESEPEQQVTPVTLLELKQLYQECLETNKPGPLDLLRKVQVSVNDDNVKQCMEDLLVTNVKLLQANDDDTNYRLLELQVGMRLALLASCRTFRKLHHELVCKQRSTSCKKLRKKLKKQTPKKVLEDQLLHLFSLLAMKSDTPTNFQSAVKDLVTTTRAPHDMVTVIYDFFELHDEEKGAESSVALVPTTEPKPVVALVPQKEGNDEEPKIIHAKESSLIGQSVSLTASIRTNKLVPDQKRKYVGSHFNTKLSNVSTLFRQVTVPIQKQKSKEETKKLEDERPVVKKARLVFYPPLSKKQVISETPAKRQFQSSTLSPMGGQDSQDAFLVAQEALAARRSKR